MILETTVNKDNPGPYSVDIKYYKDGGANPSYFSEQRWKIIKTFYIENVSGDGTLIYNWGYSVYIPCWFSCKYTCTLNLEFGYGIGFPTPEASGSKPFFGVLILQEETGSSNCVRPVVKLDTSFVLNLD